MQDQNNPYSHDAQQAPAQAVPGQPSYSPAGKLIRPWSYPPQTFKSLYTWWLILLIAGVLLTIVLIGIPLIIAAVIVFYVFLYKAWNQLQDGSQRTTPGKAVGFMFIPFYNLYWIFVAVHGLAQDLNGYARRHSVQMMPVSESLSLAYCIVLLCTILPYIGFLAALAALVLGIILMTQFKNASMQIAQHNGQRAGGAV
ncbi:MAG: DUF4328 domain-containing protein [Bacteroidota bacterium]